MPLMPWTNAHGEAGAVTVACAATVALAPADDSVDTNKVIITGTGTIEWFGPPPVAPPMFIRAGSRS